MVLAKVSANNGIQVDYRGRRFLLDPKGPAKADFTFVSHAHVDHMHTPSKTANVIASDATRELASARGYDLGATIEHAEGVETMDSGHILGSRAIRIEEEVYYTGDASGRERAFLSKCRTRQARVLVMETTFGSPEYVFPQTGKVVKEVNALIGEMFHRGKPVVLMGYPLGKAQLLTHFFSTWAPLLIHQSVGRMNDVYSRHGIPLKSGRRFDPAEGLDSIPTGPWVMIAPLTNGRSALMSQLRKKHGAVLVAFSGWAARDGYARSMGADFAFPLSDHCDYPELLKLAQSVYPDLIYTTHGFAKEFAADLSRVGFAARPLGAYQSSLTDYATGD